MSKLRVDVVLVAMSVVVPAATACTSAPSGAEDGSQPPIAVAGNEAPEGAAQRAEFGLDARPPNTTCVAPTRPPPAGVVKFERVYDNVHLQYTIAMAQPPGDRTRWFAASRMGKIVTFPAVNPPAEPTEVADVAQLTGRPVETEMEGGFLGFAFHPKFATNGRIYVTWTTTDAGGPASEVGFLTSTNGGASFTTYTKILSFNRTRFEHCGGGIAFSKEGYLLLGFGDMANDTHGQRIPSFSARILRLDVDNSSAGKQYGIPSSNPYKNAGPGAEPPEVFAKGLRNPFRVSVDRETGDIWVGDVGQDTYEEVNRIDLGGNYGWPCREGAHDSHAITHMTQS
jgi:glucose/arabinose dehydrogenase